MSSILDQSTFRVGGLVTGLNTEDLVNQFMEIERKPVERLESKKAEVNEKLTAWRDLNTRLLAMDVHSSRLKSETNFTGRTAHSSDEDVLTVSAMSGVNTSSYTVKVNRLAAGHQVASQSFASEDAEIGAGSISFNIGGRVRTLEITEDANTLGDLESLVNNGDYGVSAAVVQADDNDFRLVITSGTSGSDGEMLIESDLSGGEAPAFDTIQEAADAHITLGSGASAIDVYRSTNRIGDVIEGVTMNLKSADTENPVTITLNADTSKARKTIDGFIDQYNHMVDYFDQQFFYDPDSGESGTLFSESALTRIKETLYSVVTGATAGDSEFHSLNEMGIGVNAGGKLQVQDEGLLNQVLENSLDDVVGFFTDEDAGVGVRIDNYMEELLDSEDGLVHTTEEYYLSEIDDIDDSIAEKEEYLARVQTRYYKKFTDLEVAMAKIQNQSEYLNQQIEAMSGAQRSVGDFSS